MADLSFVQVAPDSTGKRLRTTAVDDGGSTMHQEIMVVAGGTGDIWEPSLDAIPSSSSVAMPVRVVHTSSAVLIGSVSVANNVPVTLLTSPISIQSNAGDPDSVPVTVYSSSASALNVFLSTAQNTSGIDPRIVTPSSQWTVTAALPAASTISVAPTSQWDVRVVGAGSSGVAGTNLISTGLTGAAIDPRQVTLQAGTTALVGAVQATVVAGTSGAGIGVIISTAAGSAAIDPRQISAGSTLDVRVIGAGSSATVGSVLITTGLGGAAIDPRAASLTASSSQTFPTQLSTSPNSAYIDPRQVTLQAGTTALVGAIAISTAGNEVQLAMNSTTYRTPHTYFSTGGAIGTEAMVSLRHTRNAAAATSGTFFASSALPYRIGPITVSVYNTTNALKTVSLVLMGSTTSTGTSTAGNPLWNATFTVTPPTSTFATNVGNTWVFPTMILMPSSMSFGLDAVASSSGNIVAVCICAEEMM